MHTEATLTGVDLVKVAADSRPIAVGGSIAHAIREQGRATAQAIGAGAVNQVIKSIAIARGYLAEDGIDVVCVPSFVEVTIDDEERMAVRLEVFTSVIGHIL